MAKVNLVEKTARLNKFEIVKYQLMTHCYINGIHMTDAEIDCLTLLAINGEMGMSSFCMLTVKNKIFKTTQTVRNCIGKFHSLGLVDKTRNKGHKRIKVSNKLKVQADGNVMLNYKFVFVDTQEAQSTD